jgi:predicted dehydrogenase
MIGVGDITSLHFEAYRDFADAKLVAICDLDEALLARRRAEWGVGHATRDAGELLADPGIDLVEVNTPHHTHRDLVVRALAAGKHVACQKPIATSVADAEAMVAAAASAKGRFRVLENFVHYPPFVRMRELLRGGEIGEPLTVRFKLGSSLFGGRWVPLKTELWHVLETEKGMGQAVFDDGYHKLSQAVDLFGEVASVKGFIGRSLRYVDEPGQLIWRYKDSQVLGSFDLAFSPNLHIRSRYFSCDERIDVTGTRGSLHVTRCTGVVADEAPLVLVRDGRRHLFEDMDADWQASFTAGIREFPEAIREGRQAPISGGRALHVLRFAFACIAAGRDGREVRPDDVDDAVAAGGRAP